MYTSVGTRTKLRRLAHAIVVLTILVAASAYSASAQAANSLPALGLGPAGQPGAGWLTAQVAPGDTWHGQFILSDSANSAGGRVQLYATDGITAPSSGLSFSSQGQSLRPSNAPHAEGSWLTLGASTVNVTPGQQQIFPVTVTVPLGTLPGDHVAGIVAQAVGQTSTTTQGLQVNVQTRVAMAVVVVVQGAASFQLHIGQPVASATTNGSQLTVPLTNTGLLYADSHISITLHGPNGYHASINRSLNIILPGDTIDVQIPWVNTLRPGIYSANLVDTWNTGSTSANYTLDVTASTPSGTVFTESPPIPNRIHTTKTNHTSLLSVIERHLLAISLVGLFIIGLLILLFFVVRRRREQEEEEDPTVIPVHMTSSGVPGQWMH